MRVTCILHSFYAVQKSAIRLPGLELVGLGRRTRFTAKAFLPLGVPLARVPFSKASIPGQADGGGSIPPKSAACTRGDCVEEFISLMLLMQLFEA